MTEMLMRVLLDFAIGLLILTVVILVVMVLAVLWPVIEILVILSLVIGIGLDLFMNKVWNERHH